MVLAFPSIASADPNANDGVAETTETPQIVESEPIHWAMDILDGVVQNPKILSFQVAQKRPIRTRSCGGRARIDPCACRRLPTGCREASAGSGGVLVDAMLDLDLLGHADTPIGTLYLGRRRIESRPEWIYEIQISGQLLMSSLNNVSERRLATSALSLHEGAGPLRVLVGGLGLGYTVQAALEGTRVGSVRVVEKMDFVIDWMSRGLLPLSDDFAAEDSLEIVQGDIYEDLLGAPTEQFDLILVDVDHSPDDRLADGPGRFYSAEGQRQVARHLAPGGVLAVWSAWGNDAFAEVLSGIYPRTSREDVVWDNDEEPGSTFGNVLFFAGGVAR
jgi:spermidine synthase